MGNEILKPLSVVKEEFESSLTELINSSVLPRFIIESVLREYLADMKVIARKEYEIDKKRYEEALKKHEENLNNE